MAAGQPRSGGSTPPIESTEGAAPAVSEDEKAAAQAQAAEQKTEPVDSSERFVQYMVPLNQAGRVITRPSGVSGDGSLASVVGSNCASTHITPEQWNSQGIAATETLEWTVENNWRVPVERLTDQQLRFLLVDDRRINHAVRFELVDGAGNKVDS